MLERPFRIERNDSIAQAQAPCFLKLDELIGMRPRIAVFLLMTATFCAAQAKNDQGQAPVDGYEIVHIYPHDPAAFTQGLVYNDGHLYESTGLNGKSSVRLVDIETGRVLQRHDLPAQYFGEGLTLWKNKALSIDLEGKNWIHL